MILDAHYIRGSVTRTAVFPDGGLTLVDRERDHWREGDFVAAVVMEAGQIEIPTGRVVSLAPGDHVVGALGVRAATLEVVGDWREVGDDRRLHLLTAAGVLGRCTSASVVGRSTVIGLDYIGHLSPGEAPTNMADTVVDVPPRRFAVPTILILGTSMSAGKTTAAKAIIRSLARRGMRVAGAKFAGTGRRRDILAMQDAGADTTCDFVDAGLATTVVSPDRCLSAIRHLMDQIAGTDPDVLVAEAGASPLEPYNSDLVARTLRPHVELTVVCASDPYAVAGLMQAFELIPDVVAGRATSTSAAVDLVGKLVGVEAIDLFDPDHLLRLDALIARHLRL